MRLVWPKILPFLVGAMFCKLGLDKLVLRSYDVASRAGNLWADDRLREPQWAGESQCESEWAGMTRVTVTVWAREKVRVSQKEQVWARVSQRELGSQVTCAQLIMYNNEREIGSQSATLKSGNVRCFYSTLVSYLCKDDDSDVVCQCKHSRGELFLCKRPLWPPSLCASWSSKTVLFMQKISK